MRYRRCANIAWRKVGDETILLDLKSNQMYALNETAGYLWHVLETVTSFSRLAAEMAGMSEEGEVDGSRLEEFCEELIRQGLGRESSATDGPPEDIPVVSSLHNVLPPEILWQDKLQVLGQSCGFFAGQGPTCNQVPGG